MKMRNLLLLGAFLTVSGGMMAQTSLTAKNAKVVPGYTSQGDATISFVVPATIGGWQMELSLPEGLSLVEKSASVTVNGSSADATSFDGVTPSALHKSHQIIGGTKANGNVVLICFPTTTDGALTATSGELCTIKVKATEAYTGTNQVKVESFLAADPQGSTTQYTAESINFNVVALKGDVTSDGIVNGGDIQGVINTIVAGTGDSKYDTTGDGNVNGGDIQQIINEIVL
jgi:hypothetical protein